MNESWPAERHFWDIVAMDLIVAMDSCDEGECEYDYGYEYDYEI